MRRTIAAVMIGTVIGSVLTGLMALSSASASNPAASSSQMVASAATPSAPAPTPDVIVVTASTPVAVIVEDDPAPYDEGTDPVLGGGRWGTRSRKVTGARGHAVTSDLHSDVENYESDLLTQQQSSALLHLFRDSRGVHRIINSYGGDPDDTHYYVKQIDANEDIVGNDTPWVTAVLRADFASPEGIRGIEMRVYRKKISESRLDNTPYVELTQVSYLDSTGELSRSAGYHPPGSSGVGTDGLATIRFRN
jgi:hypothetical protein